MEKRKAPPLPTKKNKKKYNGSYNVANDFFISFRKQALILSFISLLFYCNTFSNGYAFDDTMAIVDNEFVQQGISGIQAILTKDSYESYLEGKNASNQLAGGRYRPLSLITFAIEQQLMGTANDNETINDKEARVMRQMHVRHVVNVLLYTLSVVLLLAFFRQIIFPNEPVIAFLSALIFTIHPIHTEVVANVKSRDEILSVLFITLTFIQAFRYKDTKKIRDLIIALIYFFLALLSKEYAVTLLLLLPLSFYLFSKDSVKGSVTSTFVFFIPFLIYLFLRFSSVTGIAAGAEKNVMNNPYLFATASQKIATEIFVLLDYLKLLIFPYPLSADYSYNQVSYTTFSNPLVWLSIILHISLIIVMGHLFIRRHLLCFALAQYLLNLTLISNFLFNIGAPMGERLIYHSSIGFSIIMGYLIYKYAQKIKRPSIVQGSLITFIIIITIVCAYTTILRNADWENDNTLFLTDVKKVPNSALANNNAAAAYMNLAKHSNDKQVRNQYFSNAIQYFDKAITIYPGYMAAYLNRGLCYFDTGDPDMALPDWDTVRKYTPQQVNLSKYLSIAGNYYLNMGIKYARNKQLDSAIVEFKKSTDAIPEVADTWINLTKAYFNAADYTNAKITLQKAIQLAPGNPDLKQLEQVMNK